jgi:hypothetical protein
MARFCPEGNPIMRGDFMLKMSATGCICCQLMFPDFTRYFALFLPPALSAA